MSEQNGHDTGTGTTAVAQTGDNGGIEAMRQAGRAVTAERKALREMYTMLEGVEWGSGNSVVRGSDFSPAARAAFAKFCVVTRANPQIHVDLLGGKPYLNAQYYRDKVSADPYFIDDEQLNLSPRLSEQLRLQAKQALEEARELGLPEPTAEVQEMLAFARVIDRIRAEWGAPEWATDVYETRIRRFVENAPLDLIRRGEIDPEPYIRVVRECNWAGGRGMVTKKRRDGGTYQTEGDPIGDAEPAKTARTRSFRRAARNAFSAWFDQFDEDISRAHEVVEAEWEEIKPARQVGEQGVATGGGEPAAARGALPQPLPVQDMTGAKVGGAVSVGEFMEGVRRAQQAFDATGGSMDAARQAFEQDTRAQQTIENAEEVGDGDDFDRNAARGEFFATLRDAGISNDDRKAWMEKHGLPDSVNKFTAADFARAKRALVKPKWQELTDLCGQLGFDGVEEYLRSNRRPMPQSLRDILQEIANVRRDLEVA